MTNVQHRLSIGMTLAIRPTAHLSEPQPSYSVLKQVDGVAQKGPGGEIGDGINVGSLSYTKKVGFTTVI